jgi:hypothetical protein
MPPFRGTKSDGKCRLDFLLWEATPAGGSGQAAPIPIGPSEIISLAFFPAW